MSYSNKTEVNKQYEAVMTSSSNVTNSTIYTTTEQTFNEVMNTIGNDTLTSINTGTTYSSSTSLLYNNHTDVESLYPKVIDCSPQYLTVEMKKEMVIAMNTMMKIKDVEIIIPNKVVKVTFDDNTFEKAVCHEDDEFSLEMAITICITKHLLGGSSKFNKLLIKGVKIVEDKVKAEEEAKKEKARIEAKRLKKHNKRVERREKKEAEARNARIQEHAEAIKLANEMMKTEAKNKEDN